MTKIRRTLAQRCKSILGMIVAGMLLLGGTTQAQVNKNRYIKLNVTKDSLIEIALATDAANTSIEIVSGDSVYDFIKTNGAYIKYYAGADTMTIYGDVSLIDCSDNKTKITGIDASNNTALIELACHSNQLTSLDLSKNTALASLYCHSNQLISLVVSKNTALADLYCYNNALTTLDLSSCTALMDLHCYNNALTSLNVSGCTALIELRCDDNDLTSLDLSTNTALKYLSCGINQLTSLDVSYNIALTSLDCGGNGLTILDLSRHNELSNLSCNGNVLTTLNLSRHAELSRLSCYGNLFSTKAYNDIMCALPSRSSNDNARFVPLSSANDANVATFVMANLNIATAKNWGVISANNDKIFTMGSATCNPNGGGSMEPVNMNRKITLNVAKDSLISIRLATDAANTSVRIVSGDSVYDFVTTSTSLISGTYYAGTHSMTIYGDVKSFDCSDNKTKITGIGLSNNTALCTLHCDNNSITMLNLFTNPALTELSCNGNQLTTLNLSRNTELSRLFCYGNFFTTKAYNDIMCYLPSRSSNDNARFVPLYDATETNAATFVAANASIATAKNWNVVYANANTNTSITTTGNDSCLSDGSGSSGPVNMSRYITLNVTKDSLISISLQTDVVSTPIRIVSGDSLYDFIVNTTSWTVYTIYRAGANTMTIYGDVRAFNCIDNKTKITGIDASNNTALCTLHCANNSITTLDVTKNTALHTLDCHNNQLTSLDVSGCTSLFYLYCYDNQLTSLDVSKNTALYTLSCYNNQLTTLNVNTTLINLYCYNNQLTTLDVSKNTALTILDCNNNQLTSLDVSSCTVLTILSCYGNSFSTKAYNDIMCSLPSKGNNIGVYFYPLYDSNDANIAIFVLANASIATAKNWNVVYYSDYTSITTTGNDSCLSNGSGSSGPANMNRYITLNVTKDSSIFLQLATDSANTPVRIVSGDSVYTFTTTSTNVIFNTYYAADAIMTIYGDVSFIDCSDNKTKVTGIDASNNTALIELACYSNALTSLDVSGCTTLTFLYCDNNQLTSLDVSQNTALKELYCNNNALTSLDVSQNTALKELYCNNNALTTLDLSSCTALMDLHCGTNQLTSLDVSKNTALIYLYCYRNNFSTKAYNDIMCSLPSGSTIDNARFVPLYDATDANATKFVAANANIATAKNWGVVYNNAINTSITTTGAAICNPNGGGSIEPVNMNRYITLNVAKDSLIKISLATDTAKTPIKIVSGDSVYNFTASSTSLISGTYYAGANTMTIYGDVKIFYCNSNQTKITGIDASNNTTLTSLSCYNNALTSLDLSKNIALIELDCGTNQLTSLDVSKNTALTVLYCNANRLTSLDVSGCIALADLYCNANRLTSLDVRGCTALSDFECDNNQLTNLDVTKNTALIGLSCGINQLRSLDVSLNTALTYLNCYENQLTTLNVSGCSALTDLYCWKNQLTSLDVSSCTALNSLQCYGNPFSTKAYNDIMCSLPSGNNNAYFIPLNNANDTNAATFVAANASIATAKNWGVVYNNAINTPITTTGAAICDPNGGGSIEPVNMNRYITLNVAKDSLIKISLATDTAKTPIKIVSGDSVYDFTTTSTISGTYYAGANTMTIYGDVIYFTCSANKTKIIGIDLSKNTALTTLYCDGNALTSLDVSGCTALTTLLCYNNALTSLDVSKNTALTTLYCDGNGLTSLDLSKNTALTTLLCYNNALTSLDVSQNTALKELYCSSNQLTSLDVSQNTVLKELYCDDNGLTSLDLSKNTVLTNLSCFGNIFSTKAYNDIMCSLPSRSSNDNAKFIPLLNANDTNSAIFVLANASIATAKNWNVVYVNPSNTSIITTGAAICDPNGGGSIDVNMSRYITLNVTKDSLISIRLATDAANTPIRIVSGDSVYNFTTTSTSLISGTYYAGANTMTIYGDVKTFYCYDNKTKVTGIDVSNNTALCTLHCANNSITTLDVTKNTALHTLGCHNNQLTSLDVSGCTSLFYLYCYNNQLTSIDVSNNTALRNLDCYNNQLTSIDVSKNTALIYLFCYNNQLTSIDVSNNTALRNLDCYGNPFTTKAYNDIMCSLPSRSINDYASFRPLYNTTDANAVNFTATNASIATAKNWRVLYFDNTAIPATSGNYDCTIGGETPQVNMNRFITLTVTPNTQIDLSMMAEADNTAIKVVSGTWDTTIVTSQTWTGTMKYYAQSDSMVIYGDVSGFDCGGGKNTLTITEIDASHNSQLTTLYCDNSNIHTLNISNCGNLKVLSCHTNKLTILNVEDCISLEELSCNNNSLKTLDLINCTSLLELNCDDNNLSILNVNNCSLMTTLSCANNNLTMLNLMNCTSLKFVSCSGNRFSTGGYDLLMCSLPIRSTFDNARLYPLSDANDVNSTIFMSTNANNANNKGWDVLYSDNTVISSTTGNYDCNGGGGQNPEVNQSRYITMNVIPDSVISLDIEADSIYSFVKVVSGSWDTLLIVDTTWTGNIDIYANSDTMIIYGNVKGLDCGGNKSKITRIDVSQNVAMEYLSCKNNDSMTSIDLTGCISMKYIYCDGNNLSSLDLSTCQGLLELSCYSNKLVTLDVSNCKTIEYLSCANNNLYMLNVSTCSNLKQLYCQTNWLTMLYIGDCTSLTTLVCNGNRFTTQDYDTIMCLLPMKSSSEGAVFVPLINSNDANVNQFMITNASNAKGKNWKVNYFDNTSIPSTSGRFDCANVSLIESAISTILLYPNPAQTMLTIENAIGNIQIFDVTGRMLMNVENNDETLLQINVSELAKGMYFVKVGNYTTKFVKE